MTTSSTDIAPAGLRERKKRKTRAVIKQEAYRLFTEVGYSATTIEQIAEAAEVSPSTFFRYFPTKESVVFSDERDVAFLAELAKVPVAVAPIVAVRTAIAAARSNSSAEDIAWKRQRHTLMASVPELRSAVLDEFVKSVRLISTAVAERIGRPADDFEVMAFAGAIIGVGMSSVLLGDGGVSDSQMVKAIEFLEAGMPL